MSHSSYIRHQNGIITGCLYSFCLACECLLEDKHIAEHHINSSAHRDMLATMPYSDEFGHHRIRKFNFGYYCEFCNVLMATAMKVKSHVIIEEHNQNKGTNSLKPCGFEVVAFGSVVIKENVWHGLLAKCCVICNAEYELEVDHKKDSAHLLNLVQKPIKFGANKAIYREIDRTTYQCLTCNLLLPSTTMIQHFSNAAHLECFSKCKLDNNSHSTNEEKLIEQVEGNTEQVRDKDKNKDMNINLSKILASVTIYQNKHIDIYFETQTAFCRKCCVDVQFSHDDIEQHIQTHATLQSASSTYPTDVDKSQSQYCTNTAEENVVDNVNNDFNIDVTMDANKALPQLQIYSNEQKDSVESNENDHSNVDINNEECDVLSFAQEHSITYNANKKAFCRICKVKLPSSAKSIKEHAQGQGHIRKFELSLKKVNMKKFVNFVYTIKYLPVMDCIVNGKYCITQLSFYFIVETLETGDKIGLTCLLCETNIASNINVPFYKYEVDSHVNNTPHQSVMEKMPVITSISEEFIREIRPGSFHCGYCNLVVTSWEQMEKHLNTDAHEDTKAVQLDHLRVENRARLARLCLCSFEICMNNLFL